MPTQDLLFGYLTWIQSPSLNASVAGLLVTNHRGLPIEFRYTEPVEVSETQRLLHPDGQLTDAMAATIGRSLWASVEQKPRYLLVEDASLSGVWDHMAAPGIVARLEVAPSDDFQLPEHRGAVLVPVEGGSKRLVRAHVTPDGDDALQEMERALNNAAGKMRIDEPFERIEAILRAIHKLPANEERVKVGAERAASATAVPEPPAETTRTPRATELMRQSRVLESDVPSVHGATRVPAELTPIRGPEPVRDAPRAPIAAQRRAAEPDAAPDAELTSEAIQQRLRRFGMRTDEHAERVRRLREAQHTRPTTRVETEIVRRPVSRRKDDSDTDLAMASSRAVRTESEIRRWRERLSTWKQTPEADDAQGMAVAAAPRDHDVRQPASLRTRPDLHWMFSKPEGRR